VRHSMGLLLAVCCVALVGCGGSSTKASGTPSDSLSQTTLPVSTSSSATSPTPSGSTAPTVPTAPAPTSTTPLLTGAAVKPGEKPPPFPTYAEVDNADNALIFAAYFYKAVDWSIATTNPDLLRPISAPSCAQCHRYINQLDGLAAAGGHSEGARLNVERVTVAHGTLVKSDYVVIVTYDQGVGVVVSPGAAPATYTPTPNPGSSTLYIDWVDGRWQTLEIGSV
jgi:hypothetical protein